jgi:hypothetical protein
MAPSTLTTSEVEIECPNASKYALGMHRLLRWFVGTVASLLGLSLLLVRWGFWASESTVVEDAQGMRAVLVAIQTEPAVLVYGAIVFLLLVGFALLITTSKWKKWVRVTRSRNDFPPLNKSDGNSAFH